MGSFTKGYCRLAGHAAVLLIASGYSHNSEQLMAAELVAEPSIETSILYDDNIRLTAAKHEEVYGAVVSPEITLGHRTETSQINLLTHFDFRRFKDKEQLDSDDQKYQLNTQYQTERSLWRLDSGFTRNSTRTSELEETGLVQTARRREKLEISPSIAYTMTERLTTQLSYSHQDVDYDTTGIETDFLDYQYEVLSNTLSYAFDERNKIDFVVYGSEYTVKEYLKTELRGGGLFTEPYKLSVYESKKTETVGVQVKLNHQFSETLQGSVMYGEHKNKETANQKQIQDFIVSEDKQFYLERVNRSRGKTYTLDLENQFEQSTLTAELKRSLNPSGIGILYQTDSLTLGLKNKLTELLGINFSLKGTRSKALGTAQSSQNREYFNFRSAIWWKMDQKWRLNAAYTHVRQKYDHSAKTAESNKVMITIGYTWSKMSTSY